MNTTNEYAIVFTSNIVDTIYCYQKYLNITASNSLAQSQHYEKGPGLQSLHVSVLTDEVCFTIANKIQTTSKEMKTAI